MRWTWESVKERRLSNQSWCQREEQIQMVDQLRCATLICSCKTNTFIKLRKLRNWRESWERSIKTNMCPRLVKRVGKSLRRVANKMCKSLKKMKSMVTLCIPSFLKLRLNTHQDWHKIQQTENEATRSICLVTITEMIHKRNQAGPWRSPSKLKAILSIPRYLRIPRKY